MKMLWVFLVLLVLMLVGIGPASAADILFTPSGPVVVNNHATTFFALGGVGLDAGCGLPVGGSTQFFSIQRAPVFREVGVGRVGTAPSVTVVNEQRGLFGRSRSTTIINGR